MRLCSGLLSRFSYGRGIDRCTGEHLRVRTERLVGRVAAGSGGDGGSSGDGGGGLRGLQHLRKRFVLFGTKFRNEVLRLGDDWVGGGGSGGGGGAYFSSNLPHFFIY